MGRWRYLVAPVVLVIALATAAGAGAAEPPQIYVGTGGGYAVAFKVEGADVYVLGLDATVYCEVLEPREASKPSLNGFFSTSKLMRASPTGLSATDGSSDLFGSRELKVTATPEGEKLVGSFEYSLSEESGHCQTGGYYGSLPAVPFEAVHYEPVDGSAPLPPFAEADSAVYYGNEGPLETYFTVFHSQFGLRGSVVSGCSAARKGRSPLRGPLASSVLIAPFAEGGGFRKKIRGLGPHGDSQIKEAITIAGSVTDEAIAGTYRDRVGKRVGKESKRTCHVGPLPFRAARYLPATN